MMVLRLLVSIFLIALFLISALIGVRYFFGNSPYPDNLSHDAVVERLVKTKESLESGLSLSGLAREEAQLRITADIAAQLLNKEEREAVSAAVNAIHETRAAWQMMVDGTCRRVGNAIHLDRCGERLGAIVGTLGLDIHSICRDSQCLPASVAGLMLSACEARVDAAIAKIGAAAKARD